MEVTQQTKKLNKTVNKGWKIANIIERSRNKLNPFAELKARKNTRNSSNLFLKIQ